MLKTSSSRKRKILTLICFASMLLGVAAGGRGSKYAAAMAPDQSTASQKSKFNCLPNDVHLTDVVSTNKATRKTVTVEKTLIQMKAQCRSGKLVDARRREIRFFRPSCWGNPPADYLEIQQRETAELQKLKRSFAVIVFGCDSMTQ